VAYRVWRHETVAAPQLVVTLNKISGEGYAVFSVLSRGATAMFDIIAFLDVAG